MQQKQTLEIGGDMVSDIGHLAGISDESMRLDRMVTTIEPQIIESDSPEMIAIWLSLTQDQKKAAVFMAEKQRKESMLVCEGCGRKKGNHVVEGGAVEVLCWVCDEDRVRKGREWLENHG